MLFYADDSEFNHVELLDAVSAIAERRRVARLVARMEAALLIREIAKAEALHEIYSAHRPSPQPPPPDARSARRRGRRAEVAAHSETEGASP